MIRLLAKVRIVLSSLGVPYMVIVALCIPVLFLANDDPIWRDALCRSGVCIRSAASHGWNKLFYDLGAGSIITVVFYWILVRLPELRKRARIKKSFQAQYKIFKLACTENFLAAANSSFDSLLPETLLPVGQFRAYFKANVGDGKTRWDEVANRMTPYYLGLTIARMELLRKEISFLMYNTDISETEAFSLLRRLSEAMLLLRDTTTDYDSINSFLSFFWQLFAGWNWVEGYRARDIVEEMLEPI